MKKYILIILLLLNFSLIKAQSEPFLGQISYVSFDFAPKGWASCNGQLLPITTNQALFSLLGTTYGGDGRTTFALPDMQGRVLVHQEDINRLGERGGSESHTLTIAQMPIHSHGVMVTSSLGNTSNPENAFLANTGERDQEYSNTTPNTSLSAGSVAPVGGSQPHNNMQPTLTLHCIIALQGIYPSRN